MRQAIRYAAAAALAVVAGSAAIAAIAQTPAAPTPTPLPAPPALTGGTLHRDIEYGRAHGESLRLDAAVPDGSGPFPIVVLVHGGGWGSGDKEGDIAPILGPRLTAAGFTWFTVNYRLAPAHRWPACQGDIATAVRWVRRHAAQYKGDSRRVALIGYSAGGQLVCRDAVGARRDTDRVQAVVGMAAPTDIEADTARRGGLSKALKDLFGRDTVDDRATAWMREMSALNHVGDGPLPPFLLVHGTADQSVPYSQSVNFQARLKQAGAVCDLITIPGAPHAVAKWAGFDAGYPDAIVAWLTKTLGTPQIGARTP